MSRPSAAYVGMGLSHPVRLVMNRGLHGNAAKLLSVTEALELVVDLVGAVQLAIDNEKPRITHDSAATAGPIAIE